MAIYDADTDTIFGAKRDTLTYLHEEGHRSWYKEGKEQNCDSLANIMLVWALLFLALDNVFFFRIGIGLMISFTIAPEIHAWWFAFQKSKEQSMK